MKFPGVVATTSCAYFNEINTTSSDKTLINEFYVRWLEGWTSGFVMYTDWDIRDIDSNEYLNWFQTYCANFPQNTLGMAAHTFAFSVKNETENLDTNIWDDTGVNDLLKRIINSEMYSKYSTFVKYLGFLGSVVNFITIILSILLTLIAATFISQLFQKIVSKINIISGNRDIQFADIFMGGLAALFPFLLIYSIIKEQFSEYYKFTETLGLWDPIVDFLANVTIVLISLFFVYFLWQLLIKLFIFVKKRFVSLKSFVKQRIGHKYGISFADVAMVSVVLTFVSFFLYEWMVNAK